MWSERTGNQALRALRGEGGEDRAEFRLRHLSRGLRGPEPAPAALAPFGEVAPETGDLDRKDRDDAGLCRLVGHHLAVGKEPEQVARDLALHPALLEGLAQRRVGR